MIFRARMRECRCLDDRQHFREASEWKIILEYSGSDCCQRHFPEGELVIQFDPVVSPRDVKQAEIVTEVSSGRRFGSCAVPRGQDSTTRRRCRYYVRAQSLRDLGIGRPVHSGIDRRLMRSAWAQIGLGRIARLRSRTERDRPSSASGRSCIHEKRAHSLDADAQIL